MENYLNHRGQLMVMESVLKNKKNIPRTRHISDDFAGLLLEKAEGRSHGASSPAINIPRSPMGEDVASSVGCYPVIQYGSV
jgi:hypothetical protein